MEPHEAIRLATRLRIARERCGLSANEVARRAGVNVGTVTRIELAQIARPRPESLIAIAAVLDIPVTDLFAIADWIPAHELPTLMPYMRAKYAALPEDAYREISDFFAGIRERYGGQGPGPGEDEY